jgi:hypothetical protein
MRKLERDYRRTKSPENQQLWREAQKAYRCAREKKKSEFWKFQLDSNKNNMKQIWSDLDNLCGVVEKKPDSTISAETIATFFSDKINKIRTNINVNNNCNLQAGKLKQNSRLENTYTISMPVNNTFLNFRPVTETEVRKLILSLPNKQCGLDPIPMWLLKECIDELLSSITKIINLSLETNSFPIYFKKSIITPILKKNTLDPNVTENYRPISNLPFLSKLIERIVAKQLNEFLSTTDTLAKYQSAYRKFNSTETILSKITSDLISRVADGEMVLISVLDMSAAFDTVDHNHLLTKLEVEFGFRGNVLKWLHSYLIDRQYSVSFNNSTSKDQPALHGVPQGSVLGPLLFNLYTNKLESIIHNLGFNTYCYADDRLIFKSCPTDKQDSLTQEMVSCVIDISSWMSANMLMINPTKTEFLWVASQRRQHLIKSQNIHIQGTNITPSKNIKFLGAYIDNSLSMEKQISTTVSSAFYVLRKLKNIRRCLTVEGAKTLMNAFILSKLDYCNSILINLPHFQYLRLQSILNAAARFIYNIHISEHISPTLQSLHWLKSPERVEFKACLLVYKALNLMAPEYLTEMCIRQPLTHKKSTLRSASPASTLLKTINCNAKPAYYHRAFSVASSELWNKLPAPVREAPTISSFKTSLKTHLFRKSYPDALS